MLSYNHDGLKEYIELCPVVISITVEIAFISYFKAAFLFVFT